MKVNLSRQQRKIEAVKRTTIRTRAVMAVCATLLSNEATLPAAESSTQKGSRDLANATPREVFLLHLKEAEDGDAEAQFTVFWAYDHPSYDHAWEGVPHNDTEALKWLRRAAAQGHAGAQNSLGVRYWSGKGVPKDRVEAMKYERLAAEQGDASGQFNLGMSYLEVGDKVQALKWLDLALAQQPAGERRDSIESQIAEIAESLTPQQIALAQRFATEFVPQKKHPKSANEGDRSPPESPTSTGSGFFISDDGILVTNFHVVERASRLVVKTRQGSFEAHVVRLDPVNDI